MEDVRAELRRDLSPATLAWVAECVGADGVYWGWLNLGVSGLSTQIVRARLDDYVARLVAELG
jgi:hypothetical protein